MKLTNQQIYTIAENLISLNIGEIKFPVKVGFFLQKNISTLIAAAVEIDTARTNILKEFGEKESDNGAYKIAADKAQLAQNELDDLFNLIQELDIKLLKLESFNDIELTYQQLSAIMFMIEE